MVSRDCENYVEIPYYGFCVFVRSSSSIFPFVPVIRISGRRETQNKLKIENEISFMTISRCKLVIIQFLSNDLTIILMTLAKWRLIHWTSENNSVRDFASVCSNEAIMFSIHYECSFLTRFFVLIILLSWIKL